MKKQKLIARTYRISKEADRDVKRNGKKVGGESLYIRELIYKDNAPL